MNSTSTLNDCPVCHSAQSSVYLEHSEHVLKRCTECQLVWWTTPPTRDATKIYFQNEYITDEQRLTEKFIDYRSHALNRIASRVREVAKNPAARLLDVGTASGSFMEAISSRGITDVVGVEPSSYAAESVRKRLGVPVHSGFIEDQHFDDASFDIVTCLDTLCLVSEPHVDIAEMARVLKPGGTCFIELPGFNYRMLKGTGVLGRLLYGDKPGIQLGVHTLYFQKKSLKHLFAAHGLILNKSMPIGGPIYGSMPARFIKHSAFALLGGVYRLLGGSVEIAPKVLYEFRKPQ